MDVTSGGARVRRSADPEYPRRLGLHGPWSRASSDSDADQQTQAGPARMTHPASSRPDLVPGLSSEEFQRWYWLKTELVDFARALGIRASGGKELLMARIAASLDGRDFAEPAPIRSSGPRQLAGELSATTVIPAGQRYSQVVRRWLEGQVGSGFRFDAPMRATDQRGVSP